MFSSNLRLISCRCSCLETELPVRHDTDASVNDCCRTHRTLLPLSFPPHVDHVTSSHGCVYTITLPPVSAEDSLFFLPVSPSSVSISFSVRRWMPRGQTCVSDQRWNNPAFLSALLPGALFCPSIHLFQPHPHLPRGQFGSPSLVFKRLQQPPGEKPFN